MFENPDINSIFVSTIQFLRIPTPSKVHS